MPASWTTANMEPLSAAQQALVVEHQWMIRWGVGRWAGSVPARHREEAGEVAQDGLLRAAQMFDPARGTMFSTYAGYWVRLSLFRWHQKRNQRRHLWAAELSACGYRADGEPEGLDPANRREIDPRRDAEARDLIDRARRHCPDVYWKILDLRYRDGMTLDEVGGVLGICRERVRQLETHGLAWLRNWLGADPAPLEAYPGPASVTVRRTTKRAAIQNIAARNPRMTSLEYLIARTEGRLDALRELQALGAAPAQPFAPVPAGPLPALPEPSANGRTADDLRSRLDLDALEKEAPAAKPARARKPATPDRALADGRGVSAAERRLQAARLLATDGPATFSDLARKLGVSVSSPAKWFEGEGSDWLEKEDHGWKMHLTTKGLQAVRAADGKET